MFKIGIVEDDQLLNEALSISLRKEGYDISRGYSVKDGLAMVKTELDLLLLDINLPDGLGFSVAKAAGNVPVVFLTARDDEIDMVKAYDQGCEDYIVKPFSIEILKRRIQVVLRRQNIQTDEMLYQGLRINYLRKQVYVNEQVVRLTAKEYQLLEYLSRNAGQVISKEMILEQVWGLEGMYVVDNTVSVTINRLKKKIEPDPGKSVYIKNIFGMGYVFGD